MKNIVFQVITKFALKFNVEALLEEIFMWIEKSFSFMENFGRALKTIQRLEQLGFSVTSKIDLYQTILNFSNNSSKERLTPLLIAEFQEFGEILMQSLLKAENNNLDVLLGVLAQHMNSAEQTRLSINLLNKVATSDQADILCVFWREVVHLIDKIIDVSEEMETLKKVQICQNRIQSRRDKISPERISLELLHRTRCWRRYSQEELISLRQNPEVECWHFAGIVLDWISSNSVNEGESYYQILRNIHKLRKLALTDLDSKLEHADLTVGILYYKLRIEDKFDSMIFPVVSRILFKIGAILSITWDPVGWFVKLVALCLIIFISTLLVITPNQYDMNGFVNSFLISVKNLFTGTVSEKYGELLIIKLFFVLPVLAGSVYLFRYPHSIINGFISCFTSRICVAFCKEDIISLFDTAGSSTLKVNPYFDSMKRFLPGLEAELKLSNINGMASFELKKTRGPGVNQICHTYMVNYFSYWDYLFVSIFTKTHNEVMDILKNEARRHREQNGWRMIWTFLKRLIFYYGLGARKLDVRAISS